MPITPIGMHIQEAPPAPAAAVAENTFSGSDTGSSDDHTASVSITNPGESNQAVFIWASKQGGTQRTIESITLDGVAGTEITEVQADGGDSIVHALYRWLDADVPATGTVDVVVTADGSQQVCTVVGIVCSNVNQTTPTSDTQTDSATSLATSGTMSLTFSAASDGELVVFGGGISDGANDHGISLSPTVDGSAQQEVGTNDYSYTAAAWYDSASASQAITLTKTGANTADSAASIGVIVNGA